VSAATALESDFRLQFAPVEISVLARRYMDSGSEEDEKAFAAGTRICGGDFSRDNLQAIFRWKIRGRGVSRLARNTDDEIADALKLARSMPRPSAQPSPYSRASTASMSRSRLLSSLHSIPPSIR
jgi:hypothetical protein